MRRNWEKPGVQEAFWERKGAKNANFPEDRGPQERILKTGEDRGLFDKSLGPESCFEKKVRFKRGFEDKKKSECNTWKSMRKMREILQSMQNDAKGGKHCKGVRKTMQKGREMMQKCGKQGKVRKTRQNGVRNQNKEVGNMH